MSYLTLNSVDVSDLVKSMKISYETLVSDNSGRNANGDTVVDIINKKVKIQVTFRPMESADMKRLLSAIEDYVITVGYLDAKSNAKRTASCYTGTPEPDYYFIHDKRVMFKEMNLNFIQL